MSMLKGLLRAGVATKVLNEAKKPQNQAKAKQLLAKVTSKNKRQP